MTCKMSFVLAYSVVAFQCLNVCKCIWRSQFRKALGQNFGSKSETEITNYILENCSFQFMVVENFEEMVRLEHFATAVIAPILSMKLKQ